MAEATPPGAGARTSLSEAGRRPTLFSASADDTVRIEPETSIMAALDGRLAKPAAARPAWGLWGGLSAVALAAGVAGWWWQSGGAAEAPTPVARAASAPAQPVVPAPAASVAQAAVAVAAASVPVEATSAPVASAVIEDTAAGQPKAGPTAEPVAVATAVLAATGAAALAAEVPPAKARKAKDRAKDKAVAKPAMTAHERAKDPAKGSTKLAEAGVAAATEPTPRSPAPKDADVEVLAALMHYTDEVGAPAAGGKAKAQAGANRMNELTIADLVKRCKALGGDEATQCKKRICTGYWGKAEACPGKQAPVAGKPKAKAKKKPA